jgi:hypothetical protein
MRDARRIGGTERQRLMKRFRRWLLNGLTAISLIASIATADLWARSYTLMDAIDLRWSSGEAAPGTVHGGFALAAVFRPNAVRPPGLHFRIGSRNYPEEYSSVQRLLPKQEWHDWGGMVFVNYKQPSGTRLLLISVPGWIVLSVMSMPLLVWLFFRVRNRRQVKAGSCPVCGYDLRATPDRCPECGTTAAKKEIIIK